jgi:hypothetical protein
MRPQDKTEDALARGRSDDASEAMKRLRETNEAM